MYNNLFIIYLLMALSKNIKVSDDTVKAQKNYAEEKRKTVDSHFSGKSNTGGWMRTAYKNLRKSEAKDALLTLTGNALTSAKIASSKKKKMK